MWSRPAARQPAPALLPRRRGQSAGPPPPCTPSAHLSRAVLGKSRGPTVRGSEWGGPIRPPSTHWERKGGAEAELAETGAESLPGREGDRSERALWAGQTSLLGRIRVRASAMCPRSGPLRHWLGLVGLRPPRSPGAFSPSPPPPTSPSPSASLSRTPQPDPVSRGKRAWAGGRTRPAGRHSGLPPESDLARPGQGPSVRATVSGSRSAGLSRPGAELNLVSGTWLLPPPPSVACIHFCGYFSHRRSPPYSFFNFWL